MGTTRPEEARFTARLLVQQQRFDRAAEVLSLALPKYEDAEGWEQTLGILEEIPSDLRAKSAILANLYARALRHLSRYADLLGWKTQVVPLQALPASAIVQAEAAAAFNGLRRYSEASELLQEIIPHLQGEDLGLAWTRLGYALFHLQATYEQWDRAFATARPLLGGEVLGRSLLNEGYCLAESGRRTESRGVYLEALACFKGNPYFQAWIRYNLGSIALRDLDPEAERHFLAALELTQSPKAAELRAAALNGLGASRRLYGEWNRAESAYRSAIKAASSPHDHEESQLGLARVLRLSGRPVKALETLEEALRDDRFGHDMIQVARAMTLLVLGQDRQAKAALEKVKTITSVSNRWLWRIAGAELARREDRLDEAVALLEGLPTDTLHAREEVRQWPRLFAMLEAAGREVPQPLNYVAGTTVEVRAQGVLQVAVNLRKVGIQPRSRVGELLVYLLEQGGDASLEQIGEALFPQNLGAKQRRQAVWRLVKDLRQALGWEGSLRALGGAYQLDPEAAWHYDIARARASNEFSGEFLSGVYSEWVLETARELQELKPPRRDLN